MKKEVSPVLVIAALVLLVGVLGYFGYRKMSPDPVVKMDRSEFSKRRAEYMNQNAGAKGGYSNAAQGRPPVAPPGPGGAQPTPETQTPPTQTR